MKMKRNGFSVGFIGCVVIFLVVTTPVVEAQVKVAKTTPSTSDFKGFRVLSDKGTELEIEVAYSYSGAFGDNVAIGARMATDGEVPPGAAFRPGRVSVGQQQTTRVTISTSGQAQASFTSNQIVLQMYIGGDYVFLEEIIPYEKTWAKLAVVNMPMARAVSMLGTPVQVSPADKSRFSHYPRAMTLVWNPVNGAASYTVEIDCMHCCESKKWCSEVGAAWKVVTDLTETTYRFNFVGANPGRWRIWAVGSNGTAGAKSGWRDFSFSK